MVNRSIGTERRKASRNMDGVSASLNIGMYIPGSKSSGGVYQYTLTMIDCLKRFDKVNRYFILYSRNADFSQSLCSGSRWHIIHVESTKGNIIQGIARVTRLVHAWRWKFSGGKWLYVNKRLRKRFLAHNIDLMIYPVPTTVAFEVGIPYIFAIHDLQHRLHPEFPEVSSFGRRVAREYLFQNGAKHALAILVDSETGKEDVLIAYGLSGVTSEVIKVLPFLPPPYISGGTDESICAEVKQKYSLPEAYIFYPAQFWQHKNHARLIKALYQIRVQYNLKVPAIFVGSRKGAFKTVMRLVSHLNLEEQVRCLGFVPEQEMATLYRMATALVMPTFFGPTNIPVLEAFALGCPVITSDIRGIREQVGRAGLLIDPKNVQEMSDAIYRIWTDSTLRQDIIRKGYEKVKTYTPQDYAQKVLSVIKECQLKIYKYPSISQGGYWN